MKIYKREINYTGLNGNKKSRTVDFVITQATLLNILGKVGVSTTHPEAIEETIVTIIQNGDTLGLLNIIKELVVRSYAEIDYDEDVIDQSDAVQSKFENSLAFMALMDEFVKNPKSMEEFLTGLTDTIELTDEQKSEQDKLKERFIAKTKASIPNLEVVTNEPDTEADKIAELERQIELLKGGK